MVICPPNGPVSARCSGFPRGSRYIGTSFQHESDLHRGNGIPRPRDRPPEIAVAPEIVSAETDMPVQKPANGRLFGRRQEISRFERVRGGPGRRALTLQFQQLGLSNRP